jgi:hypothetical protein
MGSNGNAREEYLVRGAYPVCEYGTHHRRLNLPWSHGVYIKDKEHCLMNAADCKPGEGQGYNIPPFGICQAPNFPRGGKDTVLLKTETVNPLTGETYRDANGRSIKFEDNVKGCRCEAFFEGMWQNTHSKTLVCLKGETPYPALTTGSFLYCKYGGHVYPINSGQPMLDPPKADPKITVDDALNLAGDGLELINQKKLADDIRGMDSLGVWPLSRYENAVEEYAGNHGLSVSAVSTSNSDRRDPESFERGCEFIQNALKNDMPVGIYLTLNPSGNQIGSADKHYMAITQIELTYGVRETQESGGGAHFHTRRRQSIYFAPQQR